MALKVLMLGWELPPFNSGGLGEACLGLAKALSQKGVHVTFVLPKKLDIKLDFMDLVFADIDEDISTLPGVYTTISSWKHLFSQDDMPPDYVRAAVKYAEKIDKIAKKYSSDLIHTHDWMTYLGGISAKKAVSKPLVAHVHSTEYDRTGGHYPNPIVYKIEKEGLDAADKVISVSNFTKNILSQKYLVNPNKIEVVHNGVSDLEVKKLAPALSSMKQLGYSVVLYLGRITLQKGPEYFVRAARRVLDYRPKTVFLVVGSGDMQEAMISEASHLGILDKVIFTGFLRGEERDRIYQTADLYVMPSVSEPFGITPLEAIANGTCVLVSKQSGVSEVLEHVLKVDFWDTDEMANKILAVLKYKSLKKVLKSESSKELVNINWNRAADKCINIYSQLVNH